MCWRIKMSAPLLGVEDGKDVLAGHEAFFHVSQLQIVERQHKLLLFFLIKHSGAFFCFV